jgi:hypothetical protein
MEHGSITSISKWWLKILAPLTGLSLPTIGLLLRSNLESHLKSATAETLSLGLILLLGVIGLLVSLLILQRPWLTWDVPTGTWVNRFTGIRYCGTCKANKNIAVPLKIEATGWRCVACDTSRTDPARKSNAPRTRGRVIHRGFGSDEWNIR